MPWISGAGGGGGSVKTALVNGNGGGDITTASASFVDLPGMATTIAAVAGDVLAVSFYCTFSINAAPPVSGFFRPMATTSGTVMRQSSVNITGNAAPTLYALTVLYAVVAGDISGGSVAVKMQFAAGSATLTVANSTTTIAPQLSVVNLLH